MDKNTAYENEGLTGLDKLEQEYNNLINNLNEIVYSIYSLEELKKIENKQKVLIPILNGILIEGEIEKPTKVKVNIGNGILTTKSIDEVIEMLKKKQKELEEKINEIKSQFDALNII
ncbi:MAG: Prefoldin subunit [Candidatus Woesearchaeota archaeon]|nr:Prefoldin subunit [Candidatus Woesearchaeota archaeon]